jgi:hypothetical protein
MKCPFIQKFKNIYTSSLLIIFFSLSVTAQVGIGNTNPNANSLLEVGNGNDSQGILLPRVALTNTTSPSPLTTDVAGMIVYNKNTAGDVTPGFYYNDGTDWVRLGGAAAAAEPPIDSVTLSTDQTLNNSTYTDIPGMTLTFMARKTSVLIDLTASGYGTINSMSIAFLRVYNNTSASVVGGTMEKVQSSLNISGPGGGTTYQVTTWSSSYSKLLTGLVIGNTYSLKVQGYVQADSAGGSAVINPV